MEEVDQLGIESTPHDCARLFQGEGIRRGGGLLVWDWIGSLRYVL